jgi:hypothetical protein
MVLLGVGAAGYALRRLTEQRAGTPHLIGNGYRRA